MKEKKKRNGIIIISAIIAFIVGMSVIICIFCEYKIRLTTILLFLVGIPIVIFLIMLPYTIAEKREELINQLFILDILKKEKREEHIRITQENILFKYIITIKFIYIFPRWISHISFFPNEWTETPTYNIKGKTQLSSEQLNNIIEKINQLENDENGNITINYQGNKKTVKHDLINEIFKEYSYIEI